MNKDIERILLTSEEISNMVKRLGEEISRDYSSTLIVIGILKGGFIFMSDLVRCIDIDCCLDFMAVSSYGKSTESTGVVKLIKDIDIDISGKDVLIVEDIIDTGLTLSYLHKLLSDRGARSVKIAAAFDKPSRRKAEIKADYIGITVPNEFIVGYGLDYNDQYRNLPYVGILKPKIYKNNNYF